MESSIAGDFTANIKVTSAASFDGLSISKDSNYNEVHHLSKEFTSGSKPDSLGELRLKMKITTSGDYKSLSSDQLDDIFILFQLGS